MGKCRGRACSVTQNADSDQAIELVVLVEVQDVGCDISAVAAVDGHFGTVPVAPSDS